MRTPRLSKWRLLPIALVLGTPGCDRLGNAMGRIGELQQVLFAFQDRAIEGIGNVRLSGASVTFEVTETLAQLDEIYPVETFRAVSTLFQSYPDADSISSVRIELVSGTSLGPISVTSSREGDVWQGAELEFIRSDRLPDESIAPSVGSRTFEYRFDDSEAGCTHTAVLELRSAETGWLGSGWSDRSCEAFEADGVDLRYEVRMVRGIADDSGFSALVELLPGDDPVESLRCDGWGRCACLFTGVTEADGEIVCETPAGAVRGTFGPLASGDSLGIGP